MQIYKRVCVVCGKNFTARMSNAKSCSSTCRSILSREKDNPVDVKATGGIVVPVTVPMIVPVEVEKISIVIPGDNELKEQLRISKEKFEEWKSKRRAKMTDLQKKYGWAVFFDLYHKIK